MAELWTDQVGDEEEIHKDAWKIRMKQGKCFDFVNFEGLEVITPETRREKQFYDQSKTENKISVVYEKYILVSIKDC